jgi:cytosine/adenosine deaminase-related metal-dependent hydrolase
MASILIENACLLPIDESMSVIEGGWIHIEGSTIRAMGSGRPPQVEGAEIVDVNGDVVMPGMVNPHAHLAMTLFRGLGEDVDDRLFRYVLPMERKFVTREMVRVGTLLGALESIEAGVTTIADMYYYETEVGRALDQGGLRGVVGQTLATFEPPDHKTMDEGFALVEELVSEFSGHDRIVPSIAPHAPYSTDIEVMARVARWAEAHPEVPVQIHLAEMDSEMEWCRKTHGLRPVAVVEKAGLLMPGLIAAHCLHIDPFEIERMARADVRVAHNARSNAKAGRGIAPIEAMRAAGHQGRHRHRWAHERQHSGSVQPVRAGRHVPEAARPQPQAHAGRPGDPHGDARRRRGAGSRRPHRLAGARQAGGSHPHRPFRTAPAAGL